MKYLKYTIEICTFSVAFACCLDEWRLVDAEVDAGAELIGSTDLGRGRRMERGCDGRHESGRARAGGGGGAAEGGVCPGVEARPRAGAA